MHISVCLFSEVALECTCKYNGQLSLSDAPAGNHGILVAFITFDWIFVLMTATPMQLYLGERSGHCETKHFSCSLEMVHLRFLKSCFYSPSIN